MRRFFGIGETYLTGEDLGGLDYLLVLFHRRAQVFAIVGVFALLALTFALLMPVRYGATVVMVPSQDENQGAQIGGAMSAFSLLTGSSNNNSRTNAAIALLQARSTLQRFITENNLMPQLFPTRWDAQARTWKDGRGPTLEDGYLKLKGALSIENDETSGVIRLQLSWTDANTAATWANKLVALANRIMQAQTMRRAEKMVSYLYQELHKTENQDLHANIGELIEQQIKVRMIAQSRDDYALEVLDRAEPSSTKVSVSRLIILLGGIFVGLLIAVPVTFFRHAMAMHKMRADRA